jgi:FMNH2-dependent dimethyl sulfone monooxygenase
LSGLVPPANGKKDPAMHLGLWAPLPHTICPEPVVTEALHELGTPGLGLPVDRSFSFVLDAVKRAEALGFDITLVAERLVARDLEAWVVSSALAALTSRIQILTAVHPGIVSPQVVAKMGASLDRLSGGRFAVNVVPGRRVEEFDLFGNGGWLSDTTQRYRRMDEFIAVMTGLWTQDSFGFNGEFYRFDTGRLATKLMRQPRPPVYAASGSDAGKDIIARRCDTWFVSVEPGLAAYQHNLRQIAADIEDMRRRAAGHGRTLGYGLSTHVLCAETSEAAEAKAAALDTIPGANVAAKAIGAGLVGTPQVVAERIRRYRDCGIDCLMLQFHPMMDGLEIFARDVMPLLK